MVEQGPEEPRVGSSSLPLPTICRHSLMVRIRPCQGLDEGSIPFACFNLQMWWNWKTRQIQTLVPYGVRVQVSPSVSFWGCIPTGREMALKQPRVRVRISSSPYALIIQWQNSGLLIRQSEFDSRWAYLSGAVPKLVTGRHC